MASGLEVYNPDSSILVGLSTYYGRVLGHINIVLPYGWANRFQTRSLSDPGFALGTPFSFFTPAKASIGAGGNSSYCYLCPRVTFQGTTLYWAYISDASTTFAYRVFGDGPVDGTLFYGVC